MTKPSLVEPQEGNVRANGIRLAYLEWPGRRGPVLCLHHLTGHKGSFRHLAKVLAPEYRLLALDLRGRGDSDKPSGDYGFEVHAKDIQAFAGALGLRTFALVGHSFGASVAAYFASTRPAATTGLVLLDGGVNPQEKVLHSFRPIVDELGQTHASMDAYLSRMKAKPYFKPWTPALERFFKEGSLTLQNGQVGDKTLQAAVVGDLASHRDYDLWLYLPQVRCPTLIVRPDLGLLRERGHIYTDQEMAMIAEKIEKSERSEAAGVNHYTLLLSETSPAFAAIHTFLDRLFHSCSAP